MGTTIIGSVDMPFPFQFAAPIIQTADAWPASEDDWNFQPDLVLVTFSVFTSSIAVSTCEVTRRYGNVKNPYEAKFKKYEPLNLAGKWMRVQLMGDQGPITQFVGQFETHTRIFTGNVTIDDESVGSGRQSWIASGGLRILQKQDICESVFLNADNSTSLVQWIPAMNARDKRGMIVGNRSDGLDPDTALYCYGGKSIWSHLHYIQYLIAQFIQQHDGSGNPVAPIWTIGGQTKLLDQMMTTIKFAEAGKISDMLRELIPVKYGIDYYVKPTDDGFEITVYALSADERSIAGATMPKNPNTVEINRTDQKDFIDAQIVETNERRVDRIQMVGKRIVVCGSLKGSAAPGVGSGAASLVKKWSDALETAYNGETDTDGGLTADEKRKREKYNTVYQLFGAPATWGMDGNKWSVSCKDDGTITTTDEFQVAIRETLSWIPLKEGFDYRNNPPTDNTLDTNEPDTKPPIAWIKDETPDDPAVPAHYVQCDLNGIHVHGPYNDWGLFLSASPNHLLAFGSSFSTDDDNSNIEPRYNYNSAVATVAIESDHRISLAYSVPANLAAGDGSVNTIEDEQSEMWILLGDTIIDVEPDGTLVTAGEAQRVIRNDMSRLALLAAGAMVRYVNERIRGQFTFKGLMPWSYMIGNILTVFQQNDDRTTVGAPITSIEWTLSPSPATVIKTGFA